MHIAVNTRLLIPNKLDGIGWFSHEILSRLTQQLPDWKFTFLFDRAFDPQFIYGNNVNGRVLFPPARHPMLYRMYFEYSIPLALNRLQPDLFLSPDGFLSTRTAFRQVPVIHDLNFEHRPLDLPPAYRHYYRKYFPKFARKAQHIITVSEFSAGDVSRTYGIDADKISVVPNGFNPKYRVLDPAEKSAALQSFGNGRPYFIFVGNFSYRKNLHGIIRSFEKYRRAGGTQQLLLVGNPMWKYAAMEAALHESSFQQDILFAGRLEIDALTSAMGAATALVFPSYFEGFGIPVLEAMAAGVPVITGKDSALPEVAGGAALLCDPEDHEKISSSMLLMENDENQRNSLIKKGLEHKKSYSWDLSANKMRSVLFDVLKG